MRNGLRRGEVAGPGGRKSFVDGLVSNLALVRAQVFDLAALQSPEVLVGLLLVLFPLRRPPLPELLPELHPSRKHRPGSRRVRQAGEIEERALGTIVLRGGIVVHDPLAVALDFVGAYSNYDSS